MSGKKWKIILVILSILVIFLLIYFLVITKVKDEKEIIFKCNDMIMEKGEKELLALDINVDEKVYLESSDLTVASVDEQGNIEALGSGKAIILARTEKGRRTTCTITVNESIIITPTPTVTPEITPIITITPTPEITPSPTAKPTPTSTPTKTKYMVNINAVDLSDNDYNSVFFKEEGQNIGTLPTLTRKGFKFVGWYTSKTGGTKVTEDTIVKDNITIYPQWTTYYKYVFIIGIDGLGATFKKVSSPKFDSIFKNYAYRYDISSESKTSSAPNWMSILSGVSYTTHKIVNDTAKNKTRTSKDKYPTIFTYVRKAMPNAKLVSMVHWDPINHGIVESDINVKKVTIKDDAKLVTEVVNYLEANKKSPPTLMYVHLDDVDAAAHATSGNCSTCGGFSTKYYNAAKTADKQLGTIYNKIKSIGILDESLIIVVADHGETKTAHGGNSKEEKEVMLAVRGITVNKMTFSKDTQNRDVAAIVLYALGIEKPSHFVAKVPDNLFKK